MADSTITYAAQELILDYDTVATHFMKTIFDMNYHTMALSDESWLSDFTGCGLTDEDFKCISNLYNHSDKTGMKYTSSKKLYYKIQYNFWSDWVKAQIKNVYNLDVIVLNEPIYTLFETIKSTYDIKKMEAEVSHFVFEKDSTNEKPLQPKKRPETPEEISKALETTFNPFFYARYKNITFKEAKIFIEKRQDDRLGLFKPFI